ncbi:MAG: P-type Ca2+ transporter type [Thermoproteota archaeon]|nr:P-type Ca2+ transporter type [Thermoproteota archaeon]
MTLKGSQKELQPYLSDVEIIQRELNTNFEGLSDDEAKLRLIKYGYNELTRKKKRSFWLRFIEQFKNYLTLILLIASGFSILIGEISDALIILSIVVAAAGLSFFEEYRSDKSIEALQKMTAPITTVKRGKIEKQISTVEVVPGDVLILHTGDKVAADARVFESINLRTDESSLTGESVPTSKHIESLPRDTDLGDRANMVYMGTIVVYGRGTAFVSNTGMTTEFGKIAGSLEETEAKTPLEERLDKTGKSLGQLCLVAAVIVASLGLIRGESLVDVVLFTIALAVAAIPEALPAVVTSALAIGTRRMAKRNALIRRLPAVETLGSATVICSDKTGTMTKGEMTVRKAYIQEQIMEISGIGYEPNGEFSINGQRMDPKDSSALIRASEVIALCNDAKLEHSDARWKVLGDPTEGALLTAAYKAGVDDTFIKEHPRHVEIPFTSERKMMTTVNIAGENYLLCSKGATEVLLNKCNRIHYSQGVRELTDFDKKEILKINEAFAEEALRVLAAAYKEDILDHNAIDESSEKDLIFVGLFAMIDPPREEVKEAIRKCERAYIKVIMITGDNLITAKAVAKELGMIKADSVVLSGAEVEKMTDAELEKNIDQLAVCARFSPEHKLRIVKTLQKHGHVVAMTGDGVNDAPAIKTADIGVAMGITGTDVTKEAAAMVLADDNFATIVAAVEEGRGIYDNIQKYLTFLLRCNIGEILIPLVASLMGLPLPFTAIHYLWINLVTDGLPAIALGVDPAELDIMERPPIKQKQSIFTKEIKQMLVLTPPLVTVVILFFFQTTINGGLTEARTTIFTMLIIIELLLAWGGRSIKYHLFKVGLFKNKWLLIAIASSFALQLVVLSTPQLYTSFDVVPLSLLNWYYIIVASFGVFFIVQLWLYLRNRLFSSEAR